MSKAEHAILGETYFNRSLLFCVIALVVANGADTTLSKITATVALVASVVNLIRSFQEFHESRRADA